MCGVGGNTIETAQNNISMEEFGVWLAYREKMRGLSIIEHTDFHGSQLANIILSAGNRKPVSGGEFTREDFSRIRQKQQPVVPLTPENLMRGLARGK